MAILSQGLFHHGQLTLVVELAQLTVIYRLFTRARIQRKLLQTTQRHQAELAVVEVVVE